MDTFLDNFLDDGRIKQTALNSNDLSKLLLAIEVSEDEDSVTEAFITYILNIEKQKDELLAKAIQR